MAMTGDLSEFSLADLLQMLERGSKSGRLSISTPNGIYSVWLYQGRIVATVNPNPQASLQALLAEGDKVSSRVVSKMVSFCPVREPLGICLKRQGLVAPTSLAVVFRQQLQTGLYNLFDLIAGQFSFEANAPLPYSEMTGLSKGAMEAVLEGLRHAQARALEEENLPQPDATLLRSSLELPMLRLSSLEWSVLENVGSPRCLRDLAQRLQDDLLEVRRVSARLIKLGLIEEIDPHSLPTQTETTRAMAQVGILDAVALEEPCIAKVSAIVPSPALPAARTSAVPPSLLNRLAGVLRGISAQKAS